MNETSVLITGCSTGIGAACAVEMDRLGLRVFAGVRKEEDAGRLRERASERLRPLMLDVADAASIRAAAEAVAGAVGEAGLWGLVNNAGIVVPGPLELVAPGDLRRQLEVNVVGPMTLTQAVLPLVRRARGRIVWMGSISGRIAPPYLGAYAASKHALEAVADSLRVELAPWRVHVAIVEPDSVATPIWDKMAAGTDELRQQVPAEVRRLYHRELEQMQGARDQLDKTGMPVARVVRAVRHALMARRPRTRYPIGWRTRAGFAVFPNVPDRLRDWLLKRFMGVQ